MKTLKNIIGQELRVSANYSEQTFDIEKNGVTWRTIEMDDEEFQSCLNNTGQDWQEYLNNSDDYYLVNN